MSMVSEHMHAAVARHMCKGDFTGQWTKVPSCLRCNPRCCSPSATLAEPPSSKRASAAGLLWSGVSADGGTTDKASRTQMGAGAERCTGLQECPNHKLWYKRDLLNEMSPSFSSHVYQLSTFALPQRRVGCCLPHLAHVGLDDEVVLSGLAVTNDHHLT